ncbi:MAG: DUF3545 family protein [Thalassotalea sp.]
MNKMKFDDFEDELNDNQSEYEAKKNTKQSKRKWREIDNIKEQQRLRKELLAFDEYNL